MKVDAELIDELVTGQLSGQRYRDALKAIDAQPEKWRDCALAFLEDQALRQELMLLSSRRSLGTTASSRFSGIDAKQHRPR